MSTKISYTKLDDIILNATLGVIIIGMIFIVVLLLSGNGVEVVI